MLDVLCQDHGLKGGHLRGVGQTLLQPGPTPHEAHGGVQGPDLPPMRFPMRQGTPQTVLQREHLRVIDCRNACLRLPPREAAKNEWLIARPPNGACADLLGSAVARPRLYPVTVT